MTSFSTAVRPVRVDKLSCWRPHCRFHRLDVKVVSSQIIKAMLKSSLESITVSDSFDELNRTRPDASRRIVVIVTLMRYRGMKMRS